MSIKEANLVSIILTGGGTAGHVWPHFALFEGDNSLSKAYQQNNLKVHYVGSYEGMEKNLVRNTQPKWIYHGISTGKLRRYFSLQNFLDPLKIIYGFIQSFFLVLKTKPKIIFSKGGFVSVPIVWAGWICGIPVVIHESDATPALATKLTLPFARKALFAFEETLNKISSRFKNKCVVSGLPVRESLFRTKREEALKFFNFSASMSVILIFGGSLGAQSLNTKVFQMLSLLLEKYQVIHIVGKGNKKEIIQGTDEVFLTQRYRQYEFLKNEMSLVYSAADIAICRAGASSIFELAAARIPMILFPLGLHASRGDQIINAEIFVKNGWAIKIDELTFQQDEFLKLIDHTIQNSATYKNNLSLAPSVDAANRISEILWNIMIEKKV